MQPPIPFTHLRTHSDKSIIDSLLTTNDIIKLAKQNQQSSVVITDLCNLYAAINLYEDARKQGIKPIFATELLIHEQNNCFVLPVYAKNLTGYQNILHHISTAYANFAKTARIGSSQYYKFPKLTNAQLLSRTDGIIALSGGLNGQFCNLLLNGSTTAQNNYIERYRKAFKDDFYIEIQRIGFNFENEYNAKAIAFANNNNLALVATNNVCFEQESDFQDHKIRYCINSEDKFKINDASLNELLSNQQYFKSTEQMQHLFADVPQAVTNTHAIACKCNVELQLNQHFLPKLPNHLFTKKNNTPAIELEQLCQQGLVERKIAKSAIAKYQKRLDHELKVIEDMGFVDYYLIVHYFVKYAHQNNIAVGPGRGSGAGSLVAYCIAITDIDPMEHGLLFERFLNSGRRTMPDFDIDFATKDRYKIIEYAKELFGKSNVAQIVTFSTLGGKGVVRDVARVLGQSRGLADSIAKLIGDDELATCLNFKDRKIRYDETTQQSQQPSVLAEAGQPSTSNKIINQQLQDLIDQDENAYTICLHSKKLEGLTRNIGMHAGGIVIAPNTFDAFSPITMTDNGEQIVQYNKEDIEKVGLVKFDILGLQTLDFIENCVQLIHSKQPKFDLNSIPVEDKKVMQLIGDGHTTCLFQVEGFGMTESCKSIKPKTLDQISIISALNRPGPKDGGMLDSYINRLQKKEKVYYPLKENSIEILKDILDPTLGVVAYQEQVMQIAVKFSGLTLNQADDLRSAMGKKNVDKMKQVKQLFLEGANNKKRDSKQAQALFTTLEKFAGYGFNKSHSIAYAKLCYDTAYMKTYFTIEFLAAALSNNINNSAKIEVIKQECQLFNIELLKPNINYCQTFFSISQRQQNAIEFAMHATAGIGEELSNQIVAERAQNGDFSSIEDFCHRVLKNQIAITANNIINLIKAGFMDCLYQKDKAIVRKQLKDFIPNYFKKIQAHYRHQGNANSIFANENTHNIELAMQYAKGSIGKGKLLADEKDSIGFYLSGHPIETFQAEFDAIHSNNAHRNNNIVHTCGWLSDYFVLNFNDKTNKPKKEVNMTIITDSATSNRVKCDFDTFKEYQSEFDNNVPIVFEPVNGKNDRLTKIKKIYKIESYRLKYLKSLQLEITNITLTTIHKLLQFLESKAQDSGLSLTLAYSLDGISGYFESSHLVENSEELIVNVSQILDSSKIKWIY